MRRLEERLEEPGLAGWAPALAANGVDPRTAEAEVPGAVLRAVIEHSPRTPPLGLVSSATAASWMLNAADRSVP